MELEETEPPEFLWHGTGEKYVASMDIQELIPKSRLYVHLPLDCETEVNVGNRHVKAVIYKVHSEKMKADG